MTVQESRGLPSPELNVRAPERIPTMRLPPARETGTSARNRRLTRADRVEHACAKKTHFSKKAVHVRDSASRLGENPSPAANKPSRCTDDSATHRAVLGGDFNVFDVNATCVIDNRRKQPHGRLALLRKLNHNRLTASGAKNSAAPCRTFPTWMFCGGRQRVAKRCRSTMEA